MKTIKYLYFVEVKNAMLKVRKCIQLINLKITMVYAG